MHRRLFESANETELTLTDGSLLVPGQLRNETEKNVLVGDHAAPDFNVIKPMLDRLQDVYGSLGDPRQKLLGCLAYHHHLAFVHPFADGNGRVCGC